MSLDFVSDPEVSDSTLSEPGSGCWLLGKQRGRGYWVWGVVAEKGMCEVSREGGDIGYGGVASCHHRETALPDQELSEPSQLPDLKLTHPSYLVNNI